MIIDDIPDELKRLSRRVEEVSKTTELLYKDRDILEDILLRLSGLEQALHLNREHQTDVAKDMTANIKRVEFAVEDKVDEVKDTITEKTVVVKTNSIPIFDKLKKLLIKHEIQH